MPLVQTGALQARLAGIRISREDGVTRFPTDVLTEFYCPGEQNYRFYWYRSRLTTDTE